MKTQKRKKQFLPFTYRLAESHHDAPSIIGMDNTVVVVTVVWGTKAGMTVAHCGRSGSYSGMLCRRGNMRCIIKPAWDMKRRV